MKVYVDGNDKKWVFRALLKNLLDPVRKTLNRKKFCDPIKEPPTSIVKGCYLIFPDRPVLQPPPCTPITHGSLFRGSLSGR
jgi:hypothetical protein